MAALELADELEALALPDGRAALLRLEVVGPQAPRLSATGTALRERVRLDPEPQLEGPPPGGNLVARAAAALAQRFGVRRSVEMVLTKRIPAASGLGGGSSDAAAALRALARLWEVPARAAELEELGAQLGADVAFFVRGGVQLATGVGEELSPLVNRCQAWYVVAVPAQLLSTRDVYAAWDAASIPTPQDEALAQAQRLAQALERCELAAVEEAMGNDLQGPAVKLYPALRELLAAMRGAGLRGVQVSGSGPAAFGLCSSREQAQQAARRVQGWVATRRMAVDVFVGRMAAEGGAAGGQESGTMMTGGRGGHDGDGGARSSRGGARRGQGRAG